MKRAFPLLVFAAAFTPVLFAGWGDGRPWTDGRAEVALYDSERLADGKPRQFREQILTSRQDLQPDTLAEAANPKTKGLIRALKMTQVQRFDTENMQQSIVTTVYAPTESLGRPLKIVAGIQDWTGNVHKSLTARHPDKATLQTLSGAGDDTVDLLIEPADVFDDQLVLALRALPLKTGFTTEFRLWDSLASGADVEPTASTATVVVAGEELVRCRAGSLPSWKVTVTRGSNVDTYWFEKAEPHVLTRMETSDGRKRLLYGRTRWPFWDRRFPKPNILN